MSWFYSYLRPIKIKVHGACINFVPPNYCRLKNKVVHPAGKACKDFTPLFDEKRMLEAQLKILEPQLDLVKRRLNEIK